MTFSEIPMIIRTSVIQVSTEALWVKVLLSGAKFLVLREFFSEYGGTYLK